MTASISISSATVELKAPNSDYKPASTGQPQIRGVKKNIQYKVEQIISKVVRSFATMPDGRLDEAMERWKMYQLSLEKHLL